METVIDLLVKLTGERVPLPENESKIIEQKPFANGGIGHSQFNELLLTLGYDRMTSDCFYFLFDKRESINSFDQLITGINEFRKKAMLLYGNIKFAFKKFSKLSQEEIKQEIKPLEPTSISDFQKRKLPLIGRKEIAPGKACYLGYLAAQGFPPKEVAEIRRIAQENLDAYLTYDYMDVYIATSMRQRYEFWTVANFVKKLFAAPILQELNLRWFDPTQAYCADRIDKGLVEALMLKRATCTIYHAQETETFGKDSELAATLAQGKPVIAYVPNLVNVEEFRKNAMYLAKEIYPEKKPEDVLKDLFPLFYPNGAWEDRRIRTWIDKQETFDLIEDSSLLFEKAKKMYDDKAEALKKYHPLGLQVNLDTGVANGVLVVRSVDQCAELLYKILLNTLEFDIEDPKGPGKGATILRERITGCAYRVVTENEWLTNTFWNFYLR
jgi:hypothetical protein